MSVDYIKESGRKAKGKRPYFFEDKQTEQLMNITMALAAELAVTRERLDTVERLLEKSGALAISDIDSYVPDSKRCGRCPSAKTAGIYCSNFANCSARARGNHRIEQGAKKLSRRDGLD